MNEFQNAVLHAKSRRLAYQTCLYKYCKQQNLDLVTRSIHAKSKHLANQTYLSLVLVIKAEQE